MTPPFTPDVAMYAAKLNGKTRWRSVSSVGTDGPGALSSGTSTVSRSGRSG